MSSGNRRHVNSRSGRRKVEDAFTDAGTPDTPAVVCYETIYVRDHWDQLTDYPWWYAQEPSIERQLAWRRQAFERTGQDWFRLPAGYTAEERDRLSIDAGPAGVFLVDRKAGSRRRLEVYQPIISNLD